MTKNSILFSFFFLPLLATVCAGCNGVSLPLGAVLKPAASAAVGYGAYELAPKDWSNGEKAGLAAAAAAGTWIIGELVEGKIDRDKAEAYRQGFAIGRSYGARRQYEILQEIQKSNNDGGRIKTVQIPAPSLPGVNQVPHDVFLEVFE